MKSHMSLTINTKNVINTLLIKKEKEEATKSYLKLEKLIRRKMEKKKVMRTNDE